MPGTHADNGLHQKQQLVRVLLADLKHRDPNAHDHGTINVLIYRSVALYDWIGTTLHWLLIEAKLQVWRMKIWTPDIVKLYGPPPPRGLTGA